MSLLLLCYFCSFIFFSSTYKWNHALHWHLVGDPTLVSKVKIELSSPFKGGSFPVSEDRSSQQPCYQMHKLSWNHPRPVSSKLTGKLITIKFNLGTSCGYFAGWNQFKLSRTENDLIFFHTHKQISKPDTVLWMLAETRGSWIRDKWLYFSWHSKLHEFQTCISSPCPLFPWEPCECCRQ